MKTKHFRMNSFDGLETTDYIPGHANSYRHGSSSRSIITLKLLLVGIFIGSPPMGHTAMRTWSGGGADNFWATAGNWNGGVAPAAGDDLIFPSAVARLSNSNNFPAGTLFNSITISGGNYFLNGSRILLNAGIDTSTATAPNVLFLPLTLNSDQTFQTGPVGLQFYGTIDGNGKNLTFGNGTIDVFGAISGAGGVTKTGFGAVILPTSNTFSGPVQVLQGILSTESNNGLGDTSGNTSVAQGATLNIAGGITVGEPIILSGTLQSGFRTNSITGAITLLTNAIIQTSSNAPLTLTGVITGSGGFTKIDSDILTLTAANTYSGATVVGEGTLRVNGSQPNSPILLAGGTLNGTGTAGTITSSNAAPKALAPGTTVPGSLSCSNLTLNPSTTFAVRLNGTTAGTSYDQLRVRGTVALSNALLLVSLGFVPSIGQSFTLMDNDGSDPVVGTFSGLPEGTVFAIGTNHFSISYVGGTGNDVVLNRTALPITPALRAWSGAGDNGFWTTSANWTNNLVPGAGEDLLFPAGAARLANTNDFPAGTIFNSVSISGSNYSLSGSSIFLNAGINATNTRTATFVALPITLNSNQTFTSGNTGVNLQFFNPIALNVHDLTFAGNGQCQMTPVISGSGGLIKTGSGSLLLYGSNTFFGQVQILQGTVSLYNSNALGTIASNTVIAEGGTLFLNNGITLFEPLVLGGTLGGVNATINGPITLAGTNAVIASPLIIDGVISGDAGFTKTGFEGVVLNGNNTYTGTTIISQGALQVNGSQPGNPIVLTGSGGTRLLQGSGRVGTITAVGPGNVINPGFGGPAILSCSNINLSSSTAVGLELYSATPGTGYDQLNVTGSVNLGGASLSFFALSPNIGDAFMIIKNDGADAVLGTFNGLPEGAVITNNAMVFKITYQGGDGNDVVLTRVNPPAQLTGVTFLPNGVAQMQGEGLSNLIYTIQATTNLTPVIIWTNLGTATANSNGLFQFDDTNAPLFPMRFYRGISP